VIKVTLAKTISNRILELCDKRNITLNKLGTICGITQSTLNNIKNGSRHPTISTIKKICDGLDMTLSEFFATKDFDRLEQQVK
jgi:transcriptional regulator with XRE-family HTH domain